MITQTYIVHSIGTDELNPFKYFELRFDADHYAREVVREDKAERADIYSVEDTIKPSAAIQAVMTGNATLVASRAAKAPDEAVTKVRRLEWDEAQKKGPEAVLKYLGL